MYKSSPKSYNFVLMSKKIILRVDEILIQQGISTAELAQGAKISYNTALSLRRNAPTGIDFVTLARICDFLGVQPGDVLELLQDSED